MEFGITLLFTMGNVCLNMGVVFGVFLLLRPLLVRIVTPQQRVWLGVLRAVLHGVGMYLLSSRAAGHRMGPSGRLRGQKL